MKKEKNSILFVCVLYIRQSIQESNICGEKALKKFSWPILEYFSHMWILN